MPDFFFSFAFQSKDKQILEILQKGKLTARPGLAAGPVLDSSARDEKSFCNSQFLNALPHSLSFTLQHDSQQIPACSCTQRSTLWLVSLHQGHPPPMPHPMDMLLRHIPKGREPSRGEERQKLDSCAALLTGGPLLPGLPMVPGEPCRTRQVMMRIGRQRQPLPVPPCQPRAS